MIDEHKTLLHVICESSGDHHRLLDSVIAYSEPTIIDRKDWSGRTALMHAVENANINCVKSLIVKGRADVHRGYEYSSIYINGHQLDMKSWTPFNEAIRIMSSDQSCKKMQNIFAELVDATVGHNSSYITSYLKFAIAYRQASSVEKLINAGADLYASGHDDYKLWELITQIGNVKLLMSIKTVFSSVSHPLLLLHAVMSKNDNALQYLLNQGITIPDFSMNVSQSGNKLILPDWEGNDPCYRAISRNRLKMVKLFSKYGKIFAFSDLRCAVYWGNTAIVSYLLSMKTYNLNMQYSLRYAGHETFTLLTESKRITSRIVMLLCDHGADPATNMCSPTSANALMAAIHHGHLNSVAIYIRKGVNVNLKSWAYLYSSVFPFESAVYHENYYIAVMLLKAGCSRGLLLNDNLEDKPELIKLMKKFDVYE